VVDLLYPSEKYEFVNGKDDIPYIKWKINENKFHVPKHQDHHIISTSYHIPMGPHGTSWDPMAVASAKDRLFLHFHQNIHHTQGSPQVHGI